MRACRFAARELLLSSAAGERTEPEADALARRTIHADAVLRHSANDGLASNARSSGQSQTSRTLAAVDGLGSDLSKAAVVAARRRSSNLSVPVARREN